MDTKTLFPAVTNNLKRNKLAKMLILVAAAGANGIFMVEKDADELSAANTSLVEVNKTVKDAEGKVAIRVTEAGKTTAAQLEAEKSAAPTNGEAETDFEVESGIPLPAIQRGGGATKYPFEKLTVGQSFFIAGTEKYPNPAKSLASTINSANKRFKDQGKKFAIRADEKNGVKGARVFCVAVTATA